MIVLDTHAWLWWEAKSEKLSPRARSEIEAARTVGIPAICCWELAMLVAKNRLRLDRDILLWIRQSLADPRVRLIPLSPEISVASQRLEDFHGDPADRLIVASALLGESCVISKDRRIAEYSRVKVIW